MPARTHRRRRRHQMQHKHSSPEQQETELDEAAVTQPIFFVASSEDELFASRVMPLVLNGHMDHPSWNSFCDKLDEAVQPLAKMKKTMKRWFFYPLALFIPLIVIGLVTTAILAARPIDDSSTGENLNQLLPILFLVAFVAAIPWAICMARYSSKCKKKVNKDLEKVCSNIATSHSGVSFQVHIEMRYISVIVASDKTDDIEEGDSDEYDDCAKDETFETCSLSMGSVHTDNTNTSIYSLTPDELLAAKKWRTAIDENTGKLYYFNEVTQEVSWEHPLGFAEVIGKNGARADGKIFIDSHGKNLEVFAAGPDNGVETSILFRQRSWETPLESEEEKCEEGNEGKRSSRAKGMTGYGDPELDA